MTAPGLLLIRGLGHSGSTVLDLALGAHPQMLGLGEAIRILRAPALHEERRGPARLRGDGRFERRCTCGCLAAECPVWGPVLTWLPEHDQSSMPEKLNQLLISVERSATTQNGPGLRWIVDSYQADADLARPLAVALAPRPVRVLLLVRDVRSWAHSEVRRAKGRKLLAGPRALLRWWRVNRHLERQLGDCGCPLFVLGYEEFALAPEAALQRVCAWLDLPFDPAMLSPGEASTSHILSGNRMRFDPERRAVIRYDAAWLASRSPILGAALGLSPLAQLNRRLVYSNGLLGQSWP